MPQSVPERAAPSPFRCTCDATLGACRQWSFPLPLPLPLLGIFGAKKLPLSGGDLPWSDELEHACLAEFIGLAPYSEVGSPLPGDMHLMPDLACAAAWCNAADLCAGQQRCILLVMCAKETQVRVFLCAGGVLPQSLQDAAGH